MLTRGTVIIREPADVEARLNALGLTADLLRDVAIASDQARARATSMHPATAAGFYAWSGAVYKLREGLLPLAWEMRDICNCPLTIDPTGAMAIAVATGDDATGRADGPDPTTKHPKGAVLEGAVESNQLRLFPDACGSTAIEPGDPFVTWILLLHATPAEIRSELSLPQTMDNGFVAKWSERIVLSAQPIGPTPIVDSRISEDDRPGVVEVPVVRKR